MLVGVDALGYGLGLVEVVLHAGVFWASTLSSREGDRGVAFFELGKETFSPEVGYGLRFLGFPIRPVRP